MAAIKQPHYVFSLHRGTTRVFVLISSPSSIARINRYVRRSRNKQLAFQLRLIYSIEITIPLLSSVHLHFG